MAASFLIRSLSSRIRPQQNRLAAVLLIGQLRRPAFTTASEKNYRPSPSKEAENELKVKESPKLQIFDSISEFAREVKRREVIVREILHSKRYTNGERLSARDQKFVMDDLLCYHPNSEDKIGCGVDYIMVDRHPRFRRSRCLFVVRTNGGCIDFSYRKCLRQYLESRKLISTSLV